MTIDTGIASDVLLPGHFLFMKYGGAFGPAGDQRKILVTGPKTSEGTGTENTLYSVKDDNHSDQLAGKGGFTAAVCRAIRANYKTATIDLILTTDHGSGAAATGDITPSGTASTNGTLTAKIAGRTYTGSIVVGDAPIDICEKVNLLLNPTKLEMAMRLANELKVDYEAHRVLTAGGVHGAADTTNTITSPDASDLSSLITLANELRTDYEAHRVLIAGSVHGSADNTNAVSAAACSDLDTAVVLLKDIKAKYEGHRINTSGTPAVHGAQDTTNYVSAADPVDEVHPDLPVTSKVVSATPKVTVDAKDKGEMGNRIFLRVSTDAGGVSFTEPTDNHLASGANEPDYSSAYAVALQDRYHYIVPVTNVQSILTAATTGLKDRLDAADEADVGKRMQAVIGHNATPSEGETLCDGLDFFRMQVVSLACDTPPWEIAGAMAGLRCKHEGSDLSVNLVNKRLIGVVPPEDKADYPGASEINNALHEGLSLLKVNEAGEVRISYSITSRHTNGSGQADLSVWGTIIPTVGDGFGDYLQAQAALKYDGFKLREDPTDETTVIPDKTTTPRRFKEFIYKNLKKWESPQYGHLIKVDDYKDQIYAEINSSNPNRMDYKWPWETIKHLVTTAGLGEQVG